MKHLKIRSVLAVGAALGLSVSLAACSSESQQADEPVQVEELAAEVIAEHPWDKTSFTQGLEVVDEGKLLVGTGMNGQSRIYHQTVDGKQSESQELDRKYFGEGVTRHVAEDGSESVWQLTWQENTAFRRDAATLKETGRAEYEGEGWGICSTGEQLVMSDGTGTLTFRDPESFEATSTVDVTLNDQPTDMLNELDCRGDEVWANVWQTDLIYRIDPEAGAVTGVADLSGLLPAATRPGADVLNGIASIPGSENFYLTGKYWDTMYEVKFTPRPVD